MKKSKKNITDRPKQQKPPHFQNRPLNRFQQDYIADLIAKASFLKLTEKPRWKEILTKIYISQDQDAAKGLLEAINTKYADKFVKQDPFYSIEKNLDGDFLLGHGEDGKPFGLDWEQLVRHIFVSGQAGFGKTNLMKFLFLQAKEKGIHSNYLDRKGDIEHAVREGIDSIYWPYMRINPLCPPDSKINIRSYINEFVNVFCELMEFWVRGKSIFRHGVDILFNNYDLYRRWPFWNWDTMNFPTLNELIEVFESKV